MSNNIKQNILWGLGFLALGLLLWFGTGYLLRRYIHKKASASRIFSYEELDTGLWNGRVVFRNASLQFSAGYGTQETDVQAKEILLNGIDWFSVIFSDEWIINKLTVRSPVVRISPSTAMKTMPDTSSGGIVKRLKAIRIGHTAIFDGSFDYMETVERSVVRIDSFSWTSGMFRISPYDSTHTVDFRNALLGISNVAYTPSDHMHTVSLETLIFQQKDSLIKMTGLEINPKYGETAFFDRLKYRKSRLMMNFPLITLSGWNADKLLQKELVAKSVLINDMDLRILSTQQLPPDPGRYKKLPHERLRSANFPVTIDSILAKNGRLQYRSIPENSSHSGSLTFAPLEATILNITNDTVRTDSQQLMEVHATGYIDGAYKVYSQFWLDLTSPSFVFTAKGNVSELPFPALNSFVRPFASVALEKGHINQLTYELHADRHVANGTLLMDYENLSFSLLNEENETRELVSVFANLFLVKNKNNIRSKNFREGDIHAVRDTTRSFFSFWWDALLSGIKSSVTGKSS